MASIGKSKFLWKSTTEVAIALAATQLIPFFEEYFKTHDSIIHAEFECMFSLKRTTACSRLKELMAEGVIRAVGSGKETKYIKDTII